MRNASVPTQTILPHVAYEDVAQGIEWLSEVLGFVEHYRYGDPDDPQGAQVYLGDAWLMLEKARPGKSSPNALRGMTQYLSLFVDDVDAYYEKAKRAGATVIEDVNDTIYGERQFVVHDIEGHSWLISKHAMDVDPAAWGATVVNPL